MCTDPTLPLHTSTSVHDNRTSEQVMSDMMRDDLGINVDPQAWRMFLRYRWNRLTMLAHRIHEGKR
jgi:hypothetical protein